MLNFCSNLNDLRLTPSNRFEALKGRRKEQFSIRINKQYRIVFNWLAANAYNVEIIDYH